MQVADDEESGPVVTEVKGIRGGRERVANEIQQALAYDADGSIRWEEGDIRGQSPIL